MPQLGCHVCVVDGVFKEVAGGTVALAAVLRVSVISQVKAAAVEGAERQPKPNWDLAGWRAPRDGVCARLVWTYCQSAYKHPKR